MVPKGLVQPVGRSEADRIAFGGSSEPFAGAWQSNVTVESPPNLTAFAAVYACLRIISTDMGKMRLKLMQDPDGDDVWQEIRAGSPFLPVLRKPNRFQTRQQFIEYWIALKLIFGNTYILKERDARGVVIALYPLDSRAVTPLVAPDGEVFYALRRDDLSQVQPDQNGRIVIPASEIVHDRMCCLFHPLVGIPPLYAAAISGTQGLRIQNNSSKFFQNMSRPSGQLTAPGDIKEETAKRLKETFEREYSGPNIGRILVAGNGLKYEPMSIPPEQAQLVDQFKLSVEDVGGRAFGVPLHKLGIAQATTTNFAALNEDYYQHTLGTHVEAVENLLGEGLNLDALGYQVWMDTDNLLRLDKVSQMDVMEKGVKGTLLSVNEARNTLNYPPVKGGEEPIAQQQNWPLSVLADRPPPKDNATPPTAPSEDMPPKAVNFELAEQIILREFDDDLDVYAPASLGALALRDVVLIESVRDMRDSMEAVVKTMNARVVPEYDKEGRLIGARREP